MRFQQKPHLFFIFIVNQFHVKLTKKCLYFSEFFGIKSKTGWWFHGWNWHKIMKPPYSVGKKMKLTARGFAAARQFHFFPTESGRFHNFSQFHPWNHSQFHFWAKKSEKILTFFVSFTWNWSQKKRWGF